MTSSGELVGARRGGPFRVLRHRDFRLLWFGLVGSAIGTWMQIVAQALLVLDLSHGSALALGEVSLAQALAFFAFSLFVVGSFAEDLRNFAGMAHGISRTLATGAAYLVPNFSASFISNSSSGNGDGSWPKV